MNELINNLRKFNRKERFFLVGTALGNEKFEMADSFKSALQKTLTSMNQEIPSTAFVAMDYHLDWIYASLYLSTNPIKTVNVRDPKLITANQEDVDLLVAFPDNYDSAKTHLILCECKAESSWTNKQVLSKAERLRNIFGEHGDVFSEIAIPHFVLISPKKPNRLNLTKVPHLMKPDGDIPWMNLEIPKDLQKVTRCDRKGKNSKDGTYWKVDKTSIR
ncbi:hypothetical protein [Maribellus mangrovi]|uniref:hypothetical protein n=1 Tax=Maribellus mangrovi TaxID=3133146 RepID=UPI0030ECA87D